MKLSKQSYLYIFVIALFLIISAPMLFSDGMFSDGLQYAAISKNMAEGNGSFWKPYLSIGFYPEFYEHPPLAFGLQSIGFRIFGDSIYIERFYSLLTFFITGLLIALIWKRISGDWKYGWLPLLFWVVVAEVPWAVSNNMLENTMGIFVCSALLFYLKSFENKSFLWIILSGLSLSLGLLTKGFVCLYIWSAPFFLWLFKREKSFQSVILDTGMLIGITVMPIVLLYFLNPAAQHHMISYFNKQIVGSIQSSQTVNNRFAIVGMLLQNIVVPVLIGLVIVFIARRRKIDLRLIKQNLSISLVFFAIVLSGVLPIMISMKQRGFYIHTVYPIFAVGLAYLLLPLINALRSKSMLSPKQNRAIRISAVMLAIASLIVSIAQINRAGRDNAMISDCKKIIEVVGKNTTISICPELYEKWNLHGYYARYGNVSLEVNQGKLAEYYLLNKDCNINQLPEGYTPIQIETIEYKIFKKE